ncbi:acyltransferase [Ramlibacter sp. AN1015]|uniref:acyltransferase family protein n=1 Tax=Ramlibacter sp. AN1015 TaxID=3133428 RepID=UPI0030C598D4
MHIQSLRGLACLLLVLFHVVGDTPDAGLRLPLDHPLQLFNQVLSYVRMPLFGCIAGYVYALRPCGAEWPVFLRSKARRLLLPLLTVGSVFAALQAVTPGVNENSQAPWELLVLPKAHFWFLQALFLVFAVTVVLERLGLLRTAARALLMAALAAIVLMAAKPPAWFSADGALYLLPYFLLGVAARHSPPLPRWLLAAMLLALAAGTAAVLASEQAVWPRNSAVSIALGAGATWLLIFLPWRQRVLAALGGASYAIFLFHVFFTAASRIALERLGVEETAVLVAAGMLAGVAGPMLVERIVLRSATAGTLLLGNGAARRRAPRTLESAA